MITQSELKEALHYDPDTGVFTWLDRSERHFKTIRDCSAWNTRYAGKVAGTDRAHGQTVYRHINIRGIRHQAHRLAWLYMYGKFPDNQIDHIDGNGSYNRIANLRDVSHQENHKNQRLPSNSTSGVIGVSFCSGREKWKAYISIDGKLKHLGYFFDIEDATETRKSAEKEYGYHPNHGTIKIFTTRG